MQLFYPQGYDSAVFAQSLYLSEGLKEMVLLIEIVRWCNANGY